MEHQASDRSRRMGQTRPVHVYAYTTAGPVEERIREILLRKELVFEQVVEGVGIDVRHSLTTQELFALVGLTPGPRERAPA